MSEQAVMDQVTEALGALVRSVIEDQVRLGVEAAVARHMPPSQDALVWDTNDVANLTGINPVTIRRMAASGKIPAFKISTDVEDGRWSFSPPAIRAWLAERQYS